MRIQDLPSPGILNNSLRLQREAAIAISAAEITAARTGGTSTSAERLYQFFNSCRNTLTSLRDTVLPTVVTQTASAATPTEVVLTCSEGLNPKIVPAASAFTFSPAKTISGIRIEGLKLIITVTAGVANGNTVAYTKPGVNMLQDAGANEMATFAAKTITVA